MITQLASWDHDLFFLINREMANGFFDLIMPWLREAKLWIPLYLIFLFLIIRLKKKKSWVWIIGLVLAVGASDYMASGIFKPAFERPRPCHHQNLEQEVILRKHDGNCGGKYGFVSSHAANHFAIALFICLLFGCSSRAWTSYALFIWAGLIAFAQVYVGVHFPGDVVVGALIGLLIAYLFFRFAFFVEKRYLP